MTILSRGDEQCVQSQLALVNPVCELSPFFPGRLIKPTLETDFFHCQQMPACICLRTLPLKRHPGFFTTLTKQHPGFGKKSAAPINGSVTLTHQTH